MKRSRYTEKQISFALKQPELGTHAPKACSKVGHAAFAQLDRDGIGSMDRYRKHGQV